MLIFGISVVFVILAIVAMTYKLFFFLLLLLAVGIWGYLRYQASGDSGSYFNQTTRYSLGKSEFWRGLLNLHKVGDARGDYLTTKNPIIIEVVSARGLDINDEGLRQFAAGVQQITGQKTSIINVDFFDPITVTDNDLPTLVKNFRRHKQFGQPNIFVVYANDFAGSDQGPAKAFDEFGILVSDNKLKDLTSQYSQALRQYLPGVMLYQFGLQLGLSQSDDGSCIMQPELQQPTRALLFSGKALPDSYCDAEIAQAAGIKAALQ